MRVLREHHILKVCEHDMSQLRCSRGQRHTGYILRSNGQRSRSQQEQMHFLGQGIPTDSLQSIII